MHQFAIYTAIIGEYDNICQPDSIDDRFDYILFSNDIKKKQIGAWQLKEIPYSNPDRTRIARWVKTHPEILLREYLASVWVDGRINITDKSFYDKIVSLYYSGIIISSLVHPERICIYDEIVEVMTLQLEQEETCVRWGRFLMENCYPERNGLSETGVLYRNHTSPIVQEADNLWWDCISQYSRRDQLSFNYVLWKLHIDNNSLCTEDVRSCPWFKVGQHSKNQTRKIAQKSVSPLLSFFLKHPNNNVASYYYKKAFARRHPHQWIIFYGYILFSRNIITKACKQIIGRP